MPRYNKAWDSWSTTSMHHYLGSYLAYHTTMASILLTILFGPGLLQCYNVIVTKLDHANDSTNLTICIVFSILVLNIFGNLVGCLLSRGGDNRNELIVDGSDVSLSTSSLSYKYDISLINTDNAFIQFYSSTDNFFILFLLYMFLTLLSTIAYQIYYGTNVLAYIFTQGTYFVSSYTILLTINALGMLLTGILLYAYEPKPKYGKCLNELAYKASMDVILTHRNHFAWLKGLAHGISRLLRCPI